jgi:mRNA interferase YafQ
MLRALKKTSQFKKDKKRIKGSGRYDWNKLLEVVKCLMQDEPLQPKHRDHDLSGEYAGVRECHIMPDWLLIYDKTSDVDSGELVLIRTGSHSELF